MTVIRGSTLWGARNEFAKLMESGLEMHQCVNVSTVMILAEDMVYKIVVLFNMTRAKHFYSC